MVNLEKRMERMKKVRSKRPIPTSPDRRENANAFPQGKGESIGIVTESRNRDGKDAQAIRSLEL